MATGRELLERQLLVAVAPDTEHRLLSVRRNSTSDGCGLSSFLEFFLQAFERCKACFYALR